ncbi:MAG: CPBP family intramembrane metalloprotease [Proteobacteria bacterium]|nr:CPBP family intramembrane metalloprotease [Pseudomonadota bacterium]
MIYDVIGSPPDLSSFEPLIGNLGGLLGIIVFGWAMGGFAEEILFRGYLMRNLADLFGGKDAAWWGAALLSSLLFSLPHLYQGVGGAIQTGLLALVSAAFFIKGGRSLVPLILAHGILNTVSFTSIYMGWGWG